MNVLDIITKLDDWRSRWEAAKESARRKILRLVMESCHALVEIEDIRSDAAILLQERVRTLYETVSTLLDGELDTSDINIVVKALGSPRIYYWIRVYSTTSEKERLTEGRDGRTKFWELGDLMRARTGESGISSRGIVEETLRGLDADVPTETIRKRPRGDVDRESDVALEAPFVSGVLPAI
jgi:hypothetical protein